MTEEHRRILEMVRDGLITPEDADKLLVALESSTPPGRPGEPVTGEPVYFRRYWEIPVIVGFILVGVAGLCLSWSSTISLFLLGMICLWSLLLIGAVSLLVGWWSRMVRWVHVRIDEDDGGHFAISLPLPLGVVERAVGFARRFVDDETRDNLNIAISLLSMVKQTPTDDPISIEIHDDDGDHVLVTIA